ncbi:amidohydrolase family protein [Microbacterium oryzae]|uniref:amidohydrolase family protein n=1 Tax=Microbacterium oryzae TaxID=743009 RepID=UPI0025AECDFB|nr:amidohydrolase family protein [Microbacterium oryzae]MDN3310612.1 amidohydrolase family protein [Microbacterium oryzae]
MTAAAGAPSAGDVVVVGRALWTGEGAGPGALLLRGGRIAGRLAGEVAPRDLAGPEAEVIDAGDGLVVPGLHDTHTFFTAALLEHGGLDARALDDRSVVEGVLGALAAAPEELVFVRGLSGPSERGAGLARELASRAAGAAVALLGAERSWLVLTDAARMAVGDADAASNESLAGLYRVLAAEPHVVRRAFLARARAFSAHGVTSVKDIAFDDHLGMLPVLEDLALRDDLPVRMAYSLQPVTAPADLAYAEWAAHRNSGVRFHGFKLMTDGAFDEGGAALLGEDADAVDWDAVRAEAWRILDAGHRLALNADGDGAVRRCLEIFEEYARERGSLPPGAALSDVSLVAEADIPRVAALDLVVETYPHLVRQEGFTRELLTELLGSRSSRLGPFASMIRHGVHLTAGTDHPLFEPDLPQSLLSANERLLPHGEDGRWHPENGMSRVEVVRSWTSRAGAAMQTPAGAGTFDLGAPADIAVFDRNLLEAAPEELATASVMLTVQGGRVAYRR